MIKGFVVFGSFTLLSRVFGFIRDLMIAANLGVGHGSDVFFVAFRLPNLFRALFAEGAFSSSFTPIYLSLRDCEERQKAFASSMLTILVVVILAVCLFVQLLMPLFVNMIAPGFSADVEKFSSTVFFARLMFPYFVFISIVAMMGALLQSHNRFAAFAFSPVILNLCLIFGLIFLGSIMGSNVYALSYSVFIAGVLQCLWMFWNISIHKIPIEFGKFEHSKDIKHFVQRFIPATFGMGIAQISVFVDTLFASVFPGAVSYFYYADRLIQLPLAIIGVAISTVILPSLSKSLNSGVAVEGKNLEEAISLQNRALKIVLFMITPAAVALATLPVELSSCIYYYGMFDYQSLENTASVVKIFSFALPAFVLNKIFINVFFAVEDTKTPAKYSFYSLMMNIILNLLLMNSFQYSGIAWATVVSSWFNFVLIIRRLIKLKLYRFDCDLRLCIFHVFISGAGMIIFTQLAAIFLHNLFLTKLIAVKLIGGLCMLLIGSASYFMIVFISRKLSKQSYKLWG